MFVYFTENVKFLYIYAQISFKYFEIYEPSIKCYKSANSCIWFESQQSNN